MSEKSRRPGLNRPGGEPHALDARVAGEVRRPSARVKQPFNPGTAWVIGAFALGLVVGAAVLAASWFRDDAPVRSPEQLELAGQIDDGTTGVERAISLNDRVSALALVRSIRGSRETAPELLLRAQLALDLHEPTDAVESLERALQLDPDLAASHVFIRAAIQSFSAGRPNRSSALLADAPRAKLLPALRLARSDRVARVRHGAADELRKRDEPPPDPVGFALLDAWQTEGCAGKRSAVNKLLADAPPDPRIVAVVEQMYARPGGQWCLEAAVAKLRESGEPERAQVATRTVVAASTDGDWAEAQRIREERDRIERERRWREERDLQDRDERYRRDLQDRERIEREEG